MKVFIGFICGIVFTGLCLLAILVVVDGGIHSSCSKCESARHAISSISTALKIYGLDNGIYPSEEKGLSVILENDLLKELPKDPWGNSYQYARYSTGNYVCFIVWSFGSDGKPGGSEEQQKDIYYNSTASNCITNVGM